MRRCARWPISPFRWARAGEDGRVLPGGRSRQKAGGPDAVWLVFYRYRYTKWTVRPGFFRPLLAHTLPRPTLPRAGNGEGQRTTDGKKQGRQERQRQEQQQGMRVTQGCRSTRSRKNRPSYRRSWKRPRKRRPHLARDLVWVKEAGGAGSAAEGRPGGSAMAATTESGGLRWCGMPDSIRRGTMAMEGGPGEQYSGRWDELKPSPV